MCGEYIYKGRKFNARKETPEEKYLSIQIFRFYIRCTRCSAEITFKTDPKNTDYTCERGARRNTESWRHGVADEAETDEQRLDRLEVEEKEEGTYNTMEGLEAKTVDARREMAVADALDEIRTRKSRRYRVDTGGFPGGGASTLRPDERMKLTKEEEEEDAAAWARAQEKFRLKVVEEVEMDITSTLTAVGPGGMKEDLVGTDYVSLPLFPTMKRQVRKWRPLGMGTKKKDEPRALVDYDSDTDQ